MEVNETTHTQNDELLDPKPSQLKPPPFITRIDSFVIAEQSKTNSMPDVEIPTTNQLSGPERVKTS
jgi:hypothetical protein